MSRAVREYCPWKYSSESKDRLSGKLERVQFNENLHKTRHSSTSWHLKLIHSLLVPHPCFAGLHGTKILFSFSRPGMHFALILQSKAKECKWQQKIPWGLCPACDNCSPILWGPQHCKLLWEQTCSLNYLQPCLQVLALFRKYCSKNWEKRKTSWICHWQ